MYIAICVGDRDLVHCKKFDLLEDAVAFNQKDFIDSHEQDFIFEEYDPEDWEAFQEVKKAILNGKENAGDFNLELAFNPVSGGGYTNYGGREIDWYVEEVI